MKKFIILMLITMVTCGGCAHKRTKIDKDRISYARFLYQKKKILDKRAFYIFLQRELEKKQQELVALETLKQQQEQGLSIDEQREREMQNGSGEAGQFSLIKSGHQIRLRDIEYQLNSVQKSIFDIRALMSEL